MPKYNVEVARTVTKVNTFTVTAVDESTASFLAENEAVNFDYNCLRSSLVEYEVTCVALLEALPTFYDPEDNLTIREGRCPKCGVCLEYGQREVEDDAVTFEVVCTSCGWSGKEINNMSFGGYEESKNERT